MLNHAEFVSAVPSIHASRSVACGPLWSVSEAVVSDTGVVEALMLSLSAASNGSSAITCLRQVV